MNANPLRGSVTLVTGAAGAIGRAVVAQLIEAEAIVVATDLDHSVNDLDLSGSVGSRAMVLDVTDEDAIVKAVGTAASARERLDILVNAAGLARHNAVGDLRADDLDLMWAVNVRGPMLACREAFVAMTATGGGQILNVVSTAALAGGPGEGGYCATKFALRGFTQSLAEEGRLCGIRVHGIYPAGVDTDFWISATTNGVPRKIAAGFLQPGDVAEAVVGALASPAHVHAPEVVIRGLGDADLDAIRRKLDWFQS